MRLQRLADIRFNNLDTQRYKSGKNRFPRKILITQSYLNIGEERTFVVCMLNLEQVKYLLSTGSIAR